MTDTSLLHDGCKPSNISAVVAAVAPGKLAIWEWRKCLACRYLKKWVFGRLNFSNFSIVWMIPCYYQWKLYFFYALPVPWNAELDSEGWKKGLNRIGLKREKSQKTKCFLNWAHTLTCVPNRWTVNPLLSSSGTQAKSKWNPFGQNSSPSSPTSGNQPHWKSVTRELYNLFMSSPVVSSSSFPSANWSALTLVAGVMQ